MRSRLRAWSTTSYFSLCCLLYHSAQPLWLISVNFRFDVVVVCRIVSDVSALRRICRNAIGITFQTTSECGLDPICKNCSSCGFLLSRLSKINLDMTWISQKTDLGWQSEQGPCVCVCRAGLSPARSETPPIINDSKRQYETVYLCYLCYCTPRERYTDDENTQRTIVHSGNSGKGCTEATNTGGDFEKERNSLKTATRPKRLQRGFVILLRYIVKNKTLRSSLDASNFFLNALLSYSVVKHNFNVLEVCTV